MSGYNNNDTGNLDDDNFVDVKPVTVVSKPFVETIATGPDSSIACNPVNDVEDEKSSKVVAVSDSIKTEVFSKYDPFDTPIYLSSMPLATLGIQSQTPIAFSYDGTSMAFVDGNHAIYICNVTDLGPAVAAQNKPRYMVNLQRALVGHNSIVTAIAFHPDPIRGLLVSACAEGFKIWQYTTGKLLLDVNDEEIFALSGKSCEGAITSLTWLYSGEVLVTGSRGEGDLRAFRVATVDTNGVEVILDSANVAESDFQEIEKKKLTELSDVEKAINSSASSATVGSEITAEGAGIAGVGGNDLVSMGKKDTNMNIESNRRVSEISSESFNYDGSLYVFKLSEIEHKSCHKLSINDIVPNPNFKKYPLIVTVSADATAKVYDVSSWCPLEKHRDSSTTAQFLYCLDKHRSDVLSAAWSPDGEYLITTARDNSFCVYRTVDGYFLRINKEHNNDVNAVRFIENTLLYQNNNNCNNNNNENDENKVLEFGIFTGSGEFKIYDFLKQTQEEKDLVGKEKGVVKDSASDVRDIFDSISNNNVNDPEKLNAAEASELLPKDKHLMTVSLIKKDIRRAELSPTYPILVVASSENLISIFDITQINAPKVIKEFSGHTDSITTITLLPARSLVEGSEKKYNLLTTSLDSTVGVYDQQSLTRLFGWKRTTAVKCACMSPDRNLLFVGGGLDYTIHGISLNRDFPKIYGKPIVELVGHAGSVNVISAVPNGSTNVKSNTVTYDLLSSGDDLNLNHWSIDIDFAQTERNFGKFCENRKANRTSLKPLTAEEYWAPGEEGDFSTREYLKQVKARKTYEAHNAVITHIQFSPAVTVTGKRESKDIMYFATVSNDHSIIVWRCTNYTNHKKISFSKSYTIIKAHDNVISGIVFDQYCNMFTSSWDGTIKCWDIVSTKKTRSTLTDVITLTNQLYQNYKSCEKCINSQGDFTKVATENVVDNNNNNGNLAIQQQRFAQNGMNNNMPIIAPNINDSASPSITNIAESTTNTSACSSSLDIAYLAGERVAKSLTNSSIVFYAVDDRPDNAFVAPFAAEIDLSLPYFVAGAAVNSKFAALTTSGVNSRSDTAVIEEGRTSKKQVGFRCAPLYVIKAAPSYLTFTTLSITPNGRILVAGTGSGKTVAFSVKGLYSKLVLVFDSKIDGAVNALTCTDEAIVVGTVKGTIQTWELVYDPQQLKTLNEQGRGVIERADDPNQTYKLRMMYVARDMVLRNNKAGKLSDLI